MLSMLGNGRIQKLMPNGEKVTHDYSEVLLTTGYKYLPKLIHDHFIDVGEMATEIEVTFDEFIEKLNLEKEFSQEEMSMIKKVFFPDLPISYIFEKKLNIKDLVHELDYLTGNLHLETISIGDVQTMAGNLSEDLDNMKFDDFKYYYHKFNHKMRVISDLLQYVSKDLDSTCEEIEQVKNELFNKVVKNNE